VRGAPPFAAGEDVTCSQSLTPEGVGFGSLLVTVRLGEREVQHLGGRSPSPLRLPPRNPPAGLGPPPVCPRANTPHLTGASHPPQLPRSTPTPPPRDTKGPPRAHQGLHVAPHVAPHVALVPPWWGGVLLLIFSFFWTPAFATVQRRARAGVKWCILVEEP